MSVLLIVAVVISSIVMAGEPPASRADSLPDFPAYRQEALSSMQSEFHRVCDSRRDATGMAEFMDRLALVDEVTDRIVCRLQFTRSEILGSIVDDILDSPKGGSAQKGDVIAVSPMDLYLEYAARFQAPLSMPDIPDSEADLLRRYYNAAVTAAETCVMRRGRTVAAVDKTAARDVVELYILMPFLHVPDERWSAQDIDRLSEWMKEPSALGTYEMLALRTERPFTAIQLARYRTRTDWGDLETARYLAMKASEMASGQNYRAAVCCRKAQVQVGEKAANPAVVSEAYLALGELYSRMGHPELAAGTLETLLKEHPNTADWGQTATLRLKYLYEAKQFDRIQQEAPVFQADERCKPWLPQIMYVAWVTYRHENKTESAQNTQRAFLELFPDNPLCADMYFASAMESLAAGDYAEASRLLDLIEYRFPTARIMKQVQNIKSRLSQTGQDKKE
jgi:outer membrane protein assembly factor BamD (BamD/ComL family)